MTPPRAIVVQRPSLISQLFRAVVWVCFVVCVYLGTVTYLVYLQGQQDQTQRADAAVVLGAAVWVGNPSPVLKARLDHALQLYQTNTIDKIIVTGGIGTGDNISEAEAGAAYLIDNGVPATDILQETVGKSTFQSLQGAVILAQANNIESVLIVSDPFHMLRSLKMAGDLGLSVSASPTTTSPISRRPAEEWLYMVRESVAYTSYLFAHH